MADLIPPVVATLTANIGEYQAEFAAAGESAAALGAETAAAGERITAGMTEAGAGVTGFSSKVAEEAGAVTASNDKILASMAALSAQADRTAEQFYVDYTGMAAKTQQLSAQMEVANARAAASTEALGATMATVAAETDTSFGARMAGAQKPLLLLGAAAGVVAIATTKMAADFESSTTRLVTSAGETQSNLGMVRDGILSMAGQVGNTAEELSKAMYTIESGGQHGADGLQVLRAAAEGAKTENAQLATVADAVTSVLVDYHLKASDAASVTSKLVAATSAGKTTFEELSGAMSAVLPVASAAHVSIDDVLGDLAAMTVHGMSAQQAAQNLTDTIRHMQSPTAVQSKELALLGISSQDLANDLGTKGLSGTLQMIQGRIQQSLGPGAQKVILDLGTALKTLPKAVQDLGQKLLEGSITQKEYNKAAQAMDPIAAHQASQFATLAASTHTIGNQQVTGGQVMQSYGQALNKATGDATGLNVALMLTGENAGVTNGAIKTVAGAATEAGNHVKGWGEIQQTFNQKMAEAKDGLGALGIAVGEKLLPPLSAMAGVLAKGAEFLASHKVAATAAAVVVGGVLTVAFAAAAVAAWSFTAAMLADPLVWIVVAIVAAIALLAFGLYELITHLKQVGDFFADVWNTAWKWTSDRITDIVNFVKGLPRKMLDSLSSLGSFLGDVAKRGWEAFTGGLKTAWNATLNFLKNLPHEIGYALGFLAGTLARLAIDGWNHFTAGIKTAWNATVQFFKDLPMNIVKFLVGIQVWLQTSGHDLLVGLWHGIENGWNATVQFFHDLPGNILKWLEAAGTWLLNTGINLLVGMWHGIQSGWTHTVQFFHDLPGNVLHWLGGAGSWLLDVGRNLLEGLWHGIQNAAGWLWDQVTSWAHGIVQGIKDAMGINSPSRHTHAMGVGLLEGLANGIHAATPLAITAVNTMAAKVLAAHQTSGLGMPLTIDGSMSASAMAAPTLAPTSGNAFQFNLMMNARDLQKFLQEGTLRYNLRNSSNGLAVAS